MGKASIQNITQSTSNIGEAQRPYYNTAMQEAAGLLTTPTPRYVSTDPKTGVQTPIARIANFTGQQQKLQKEVAGMQAPGQFGQASNLAGAAGLGALQAGQYDTGQFGSQQIGQPNLQTYSMQEPSDVQAEQYGTPQMQASQTGYNPSLNYFQQQGPQQFGSTQASQYMSPYTQNVIDVQKNEAIRDAQKGQLAQNLSSVRQGTYGGARQLLAGTERERNLGTQLGNIQAQGQQAAYQNAQEQFERDRAAGMTTGAQNQQAALQTQQLGTQTGVQTALANLDAASQANVQNLAAQLQTQGLNAEQAMRAALANQQSQLTTGQQNLSAALDTQRLGAQTGLAALQSNQQSDLDRQRMAEQSRQFGAQQGLAGMAQANQSAQTLANIGQTQQNADAQRLGMQQSTAAQEQALNQQKLDLSYSDFQRETDDPYIRLQRYMNILSGVPQNMSTTTTQSAPSPGLAQQLAGAGLGAYSTYKMFTGG